MINFNGTVAELLDLADLLRRGIESRKAEPSGRVLTLIKANERIKAIQEYRYESGCSLTDSKEYIDSLIQRLT